ncbi:MAG: hypothetical protein WDW38_005182 [Sanguina aurantia]
MGLFGAWGGSSLAAAAGRHRPVSTVGSYSFRTTLAALSTRRRSHHPTGTCHSSSPPKPSGQWRYLLPGQQTAADRGGGSCAEQQRCAQLQAQHASRQTACCP